MAKTKPDKPAEVVEPVAEAKKPEPKKQVLGKMKKWSRKNGN